MVGENKNKIIIRVRTKVNGPYPAISMIPKVILPGGPKKTFQL